jgi:hypothetical protein
MAHDVFISHSTKDKLTADAICHSLEQNGIRCWIAPRDVRAGANYGAEIMHGIKDCKVLILIFSWNSNASLPVVKEVETAFSNGKTIIPFRVDKTKVSDELSFYIAGNHWIDAYPNDRIFKELVNNVKRTLGMPVAESVEEGAREKEKTGFFKKLFGTKQQKQSTPQAEHKPVAQSVPVTRHQPVTQPATTPPKPASNPEQIIRKPMPPANPTDPIKPAGKAEIIFCDRSHYIVPANYLYIRAEDKLHSGFAKYYNGVFPIVKFRDIKRYQIVTQAKGEGQEYKAALEFTEGATQSMILTKNRVSSIVFPNDNETIIREFKDIACIIFDQDTNIEFETQEVKIYLKNGVAYNVPYPLLWFGSRVKPKPNVTSPTSGINWEDSLSLHNYPKISTTQLKLIRFNEVKIGNEVKNEKNWLDKCEVELELRDGSSKTGDLAMDSLHIWTVKADGPFEILVQDVDRIEFGDLPVSPTVSALPAVDRLPELTIVLEKPEEINVTDSDKYISFETLPQPVYPTISDVPSDALVYTPKGIAIIKTSSGEIHYAIANSIMFYRGNMKESYIETTDKEKLPVGYFETVAYTIEKDSQEGKIHITDTDGDDYESGIFRGYHAVHYIELPTLEQKKVEMKQSFTIAFDWDRHANVDLKYALIEKDNDTPLVVPGICFGFDYISIGMGVSRNTQRIPIFKDGLTMPSNKIRSFDITEKKSLSGYDWGISMDIVKKNGEKITAYTSGNIHVFMLTANGIEYIHLQKLKRIVYLD